MNRRAPTIIRQSNRVLGVVQIGLGVAFWTGNALGLVPLHMGLGLLITILLLTAGIIGLRAKVNRPLAIVSLGWVVVLPVFGVVHVGLLVGDMHWIIQALHLLVGMAALGLIENLMKPLAGGRGAAQPVGSREPAV